MNQLIFDFAAHDYPGSDQFLGTQNAELIHVLRHKNNQFVYVCGDRETGRGRLLQAWVAQAAAAGKKAVYADAAATALIEAAFDAEYLAIDQIERLDNEEQALLFALFNRMRNSGRGFLLLGSEYTPQQLVIREDLRTRLAYCLVYEIKPLTDREKAAALASMAAARQMKADPEIFEYLLNHWRRDMDSLTGMLVTLDNYAVAMGRRITLPLLRQLLKQQETE